jgi:erythromycin esterase
MRIKLITTKRYYFRCHFTVKNKTVLLFCTLLYFGNIHAQQPLNLGFEVQSVEGINRPWGWSLLNWGELSFEMDSIAKRTSKYSLKLRCKNSSSLCPTQSIRYDIEPYELKNNKIQVEGYIKTESIEEFVSFSIGYSYLNKENNYSAIDTTSDKIFGTTDWTKYSLNLHIPEHAIGAFIQINYTGNGIAWFDDFRLKIGTKVQNELKTGKSFSKHQMNWLYDHSSEISSNHFSETVKANNDLELFKKTVGTSELIGLGEATHGTSEFFTLKHALLQYAVTELGFRVFALEDNQIAVEKINIYVHTGNGTALQSMSGLFDVWYREEMLKMVEWVRLYNSQNQDDQVSFVGFDMQEVAGPVDSLLSFLLIQDVELYEKYKLELLEIKKESKNIYQVTDSTKLKWNNNFNSLLTQIKEKKASWLAIAKSNDDSLTILLGIQYANLVKQFAENAYKGHWSLYRDEAMAENISWLKEERFPKSKIVIWAHDVHISRCDHPNELYNLNFSISMGSYLSKKYGQNYKAFSLSTYQGNYL